MSEFKFACPVCGQHITVDASTSGTQLECPTCFQKVIVPQAPASGDSKFILAASQANKPRPTAAWESSNSVPTGRSTASRLSLAGVALLVLAVAAGAAVYIFKKQPRVQPVVAELPKTPTNAPAKAAKRVVPRVRHPVPTNVTWTLDLTNAVIPESRAVGSVNGVGFRCGRAVLRGGTLVIHQANDWAPEARLVIPLAARQAEDLSGKSIEVSPDRAPPIPRLALVWKDEQQHARNQEITNGYMLKLLFGEPASNRMPVSIYVCLPDEAKSFVAGTFKADIAKPPPLGKGKAKGPK